MITMLKQERKQRSWSQQYVAGKIGITQTALQKIETGKRKPSYDVLVKLLDLFGYNDPRLLFAVADETNQSSCKE